MMESMDAVTVRMDGKDFKEAMKWHKLAAAQGAAMAHYRISMMFCFRQGVKGSFAILFKWTQLAAEKGLQIAQRGLDTQQSDGVIPKLRPGTTVTLTCFTDTAQLKCVYKTNATTCSRTPSPFSRGGGSALHQ